MQNYQYNADIGTFTIKQVGHEYYELWLGEEMLGSYESPELAASDVADFNTGYIEWDLFKNEERNIPSDLSDWSHIEEERPL